VRRCLAKVAGALRVGNWVSGRASVYVCVGVGVDVGGCSFGRRRWGEIGIGLDVAALIEQDRQA
jgi:hypothetical protein